MSSTFSAYYTALSGIQTAQYNLKVTGQNMSNVNTDGYTRQALESYAVPSSGNNMRYSNRSDLAIGEGVKSTGVRQLRDPYLDVRFRMEQAKEGKTSTELSTMNDLETIFDEVKKSGINSQLTDLVGQLNKFANSPSDTSLENIVKNSALLLSKAFNSASEQLTKIRNQQTDSFQNNSINKANDLLQKIAELNQEIKSADVSQIPALELTDQRNLYLDQLSKYANIQISAKAVPVGAGRTVDEMSVNLVADDGTKFNLVSNDKYNHFEMSNDPAGNPVVTLKLKNSNGDDVFDSSGTTKMNNGLVTKGEFSGYLSMLNDSGEFDADPTANPPVASTTRGIGYYQKALNKMASTFADMMNTANSTDASGSINKPLFTTDDGKTTTGITASNISISDAWNDATGIFITATKNDVLPGVDNSKAGKNILYMINQFTKQQPVYADTIHSGSKVILFNTSINSFVSDISTTLGLDIDTTKSVDSSFTSTINDIDTNRQALSSVDVNEETVNMTMYNQALAASSRFMTTMDEVIDTLINKMGVAGR
ncbi:MAG TPA: flagellar hook-associated protein FlgK [Caproiciproducens sp.]|nr:flagellar hook-associated protein FlgK [Caproiciproducens sp.]